MQIIQSISKNHPIFKYLLISHQSFSIDSYSTMKTLMEKGLLILKTIKEEGFIVHSLVFNFLNSNLPVETVVFKEFDVNDSLITYLCNLLKEKQVNEIKITGKGIVDTSNGKILINDLVELKIERLDSFYISIISKYDVWLPYSLEGYDNKNLKSNRNRLERLIKFILDSYSEEFEIEPEWENHFIEYDKDTLMPKNLMEADKPFDVYDIHKDRLLTKIILG